MKEKIKYYDAEIYELQDRYEGVKGIIIGFAIGLLVGFIVMNMQSRTYQNEINDLETKIVMYEHSIYDGGYENANM